MAPAPTPNWTHPVEVVRVIDGDTFVGRVDLGRYWGGAKALQEGSIRVNGLWSPERDEPNGLGAYQHLTLLLAGSPLIAQTLKPSPQDVYGRVVASVWANGQSVAEAMIRDGYGFATKAELERWLGQQA